MARAGIAPPLAAQHAHRIVPFVTAAVEPSPERGEAEADRSAAARVTPFARRQLLLIVAYLVLGDTETEQPQN